MVTVILCYVKCIFIYIYYIFTIASKINVTPQRCLLAHFEATLDISSSKFCQIYYCGQISLQSAAVGCCFSDKKLHFQSQRKEIIIFNYAYSYQQILHWNVFKFLLCLSVSIFSCLKQMRKFVKNCYFIGVFNNWHNFWKYLLKYSQCFTKKLNSRGKLPIKT